jgi:predicted metal-binding protein
MTISDKRKYEKYVERAKELGAKDAKVITAKSIVAAEWVRLKCKFGCDGYGQSLACPPNSPAPDETRRALGYYKYALLVQGDECTNIRGIIPALEKEIFLDRYFKAFGMAAGPCNLCAKCGKTCRHPDKARPALEACGIDVFTTVRSNGFPIKVLKEPDCGGNYYGIVLIE